MFKLDILGNLKKLVFKNGKPHTTKDTGKAGSKAKRCSDKKEQNKK